MVLSRGLHDGSGLGEATGSGWTTLLDGSLDPGVWSARAGFPSRQTARVVFVDLSRSAQVTPSCWVSPAESFLHQAVEAAPRAPAQAGLREIGGLVGARDAGLVVHAVALTSWHANHRSAHLRGSDQTSQLRRGPAVHGCGSLHFRVPIGGDHVGGRRSRSRLLGVIRCLPPSLLHARGVRGTGRGARAGGHPGGRRRGWSGSGRGELAGSQPWPFPSSMMIGFFAHAATTDIKVDGDEISEARGSARRPACCRRGAQVVFLRSDLHRKGAHRGIGTAARFREAD